MRDRAPRTRRAASGLACCLVLAAALAAAQEDGEGPPVTPGPVVAVGGGGTTEAILARTLALAGGPGATVVVLGQASRREDAGEGSAEMWREVGAGEVTNLALDDPAAARAAIGRADLIWMSGGAQDRLLAALQQAGVVEALRARHAAGAVVGGTSAGAAVLSELVITGEADLERVAFGTTELIPGLAVWPGTIVDQHALARQRLNRSISAVLDHPGLVGLAIDERTAAIRVGERVEVVGDHNVVVIDARGASVPEARAGAPAAGTGLHMHVLRDGMTLDLGAREPETEPRGEGERSGSGS